MSKVNWLEVFCGFGVFLFSLRLLNALLERSLAKRLRPIINRLFASPIHCISFGIVSTVLVQASSITIITAMGLLNASLITLEQGFLVMLGSILGTTLKIWIFAENVRSYALLIIGVSSLSLLIFRKNWTRDFWEILLALGMAFFGFNMMALELTRLSGNVEFLDWFTSYNSSSLSLQLLGVLVGCIVAILVQSSSTLVLLILGFSGKGLIPFDAAVVLILGANIGTTSTALFVSMDYGISAKRLAVAHFLVKIFGVFLVLLLFPYFLALVDFLIPGTSSHQTKNCEYHLACIHTLFNFFNLLLWSPFSYLMVKFLTWLMPGEINSHIALPNIVRQILVSNTNLTIQEIENQMQESQTKAKILTDYCFDMLIYGYTRYSQKQQFSSFLVKDFECLKECVLELLIKLGTRLGLHDDKRQYIRQNLRFMHQYSNFYYHLLEFCRHLEQGFIFDKYHFPDTLRPEFEQLQILINQMWFAIFQKKNCEKDLPQITTILANLEKFYFSALSQSVLQYEELAWIYESFNYLEQIYGHLEQLYNLNQQILNYPRQ